MNKPTLILIAILTFTACGRSQAPTQPPAATDPPAAAAGLLIELSGDTDTVSDNYTLTSCPKSVLTWSVEPGGSGAAAIAISLHNVDSDRTIQLVTTFKMEHPQPLTGEALHNLDAGTYYLQIQNITGPWSILWECK